jgi:hypothetical protein
LEPMLIRQSSASRCGTSQALPDDETSLESISAVKTPMTLNQCHQRDMCVLISSRRLLRKAVTRALSYALTLCDKSGAKLVLKHFRCRHLLTKLLLELRVRMSEARASLLGIRPLVTSVIEGPSAGDHRSCRAIIASLRSYLT